MDGWDKPEQIDYGVVLLEKRTCMIMDEQQTYSRFRWDWLFTLPFILLLLYIFL